MATDTTPNPLEMSDDEILNMSSPPTVLAAEGEKEEEVTDSTTDATADDTSADTGGGEGVDEKADTKVDDNKTEVKPEDKVAEVEEETAEPEVKIEDLSDEDILAGKGKPNKKKAKAEAAKTEDKVEDKTKPTEDSGKTDEVDDKTTDSQVKETAVEVNYEESYKKIMAPFKANGKTIELRDPEEAIKLMQMGANYTRRMQELTPHRKTLMMLESNGITTDKLSFLIDLEKKDPEAIKKLLKDSNIDPIDIDVSTDADYKPGNHQVDDAEVNFKTTMDEVASTPEGRETLQDINAWDDASKEALWDRPEIMSVIHEHRASGVYDAIKTEVDRRITLGQVQANTPFLEAYKTVGDEMAAAALAEAKSQETEKPEPETITDTTTGQSGTVVATRAATPKPALKDNDKAAAASLTRSSPTKVEPQKNFLAMSDEEFLKQTNGRY